MNMKRVMMIAALAAILGGLCPVSAEAAGAPYVTNTIARQRYPWNGLVDITCKVAGINGTTNGLKLAVAAVMPETGNARNVSHFWVVQGGTNSVDREVHTNGNYRLLWDARTDLGIVRYTNMVVRISFDAHEKVQLWEGGPYWATTNIGAEKPEDYGYYFWWGDTVGYKREGDAWVATDGSSSNFSFNEADTATYGKEISTLQSEGWIVSKDGTYVLAPEHDAAQVQWGGGWRMPTYQELYDLCLFAVVGITPLTASSSPALAAATGLRSPIPVRTATTGRPSRARTVTTRGSSSSVRVTATRTTTTSTGSPFALSKGSPNSERSERIQFFNSLILLNTLHGID